MNTVKDYAKLNTLPGKLRHLVKTGTWYKKPIALKKADTQIIMQIVKEFKDASEKDIQSWRQALDATTDPNNPKWAMLQDLYDYLEPDAQLGTSRDIRVAATLGLPFTIYDTKTGLEQPEKTALLQNKEWFFHFVWHFLDTVFVGYTVAQLTDPNTMEFNYIPRRNIIPDKNFVLFEVNGEKGVNYTDPAFANSVIAVKYKHKYGILNDIVPNLIWKKNARQAWAEFGEKFGIPPIWATTTKRDKTTLDRIELMLKNLAEAATAVLPEGTTVTVQDQTAKGDPYNVYLKQIELDDQQIAKRLLGGTMITDAGSSRSQSEVHERTLHETLGLFDRMLILFVVNDYLLPLMRRVGYPLAETDAFRFDDTEELCLTDLWTIVAGMLDKFEIDTEWVAKKFNVPILGVKPQQPVNFKAASFVPAAALEANGIKLPTYNITSCCPAHRLPQAAFTDTLLAELSELLLNELWQGKDALTTEVLKSVAGYKALLNGLVEGWSDRRMQLTYDATDNHALAAMEYNLFEFSRLKEKANVFYLNQLLIDKETNNVRSFVDFRNEALPYLKNADVNWLKTEYNHAVAVGQNASRYHQQLSEKDTVTQWVQWQTIGDSRVRAEHAALNGKIFNLNDKGLSIYPPKDWGCRCEMVQYLGTPPKEQILTNAEGLKILDLSEKSKWAVNRGEAEQVFTANEMYLKDHNFTAEGSNLSFSTYGLKPIEQLTNLPKFAPDSSINAYNISELWKPEPGKTFMGFEDYFGRKFTLQEQAFKEQTKAERKQQLFAKVQDVLKTPDEVYFTKNKGAFETKYIKHYEEAGVNKSIVVSTKTENGSVIINEWADGNKHSRTGYLIHKPKSN